MQENLSTEIPFPKHHAFVNRTGLIYGRLTVLRYKGTNRFNKALWECRCECGKVIVTKGSHLANGETQSCGCYMRDLASQRKTHGQSKTSLYSLWCQMIARCDDPRNKNYPQYGGRGISVCKSWHLFVNFAADIGQRPAKHTLDRINNNGGYWCGKCEECIEYRRPPNCRWATAIEQANNKRNNRMLTYQGETLALPQWARRLGVVPSRIAVRLHIGWSVERALSTPVLPKGKTKHKKS